MKRAPRFLMLEEATVSRVLRRQRETGSIEPAAPGGGNFSPIAGKVVGLLKAIVEQLPDATVAELTTALVERSGTSTSRSAVLRALQRIGYSRKKTSFVATERDTPEHRARRRAFCAFLAATSARRLVFIDESFCKTTPPYSLMTGR